ncbi:MAG: beta-galactosidase [Bacteroidales bacterium]|nr:beta-galactosidase [Bacteroidales bacterium]
MNKQTPVNLIFLLLTLFVFGFQPGENPDKIDLSGSWQFAIDSSDKGISEAWFRRSFPENVTLPGSMTSNGKGDNVTMKTKWTGGFWNTAWFTDSIYEPYRADGNIKVSFWLQPLKHYVGVAWYKKTITIPQNWKQNHAELFLERCHWETSLWIDDQYIGMQNALGTPHQYKIGKDILTPGEHTLTLRIDNRIKDIDPGSDAHSISDNTQTNWNGVIGQMYLKQLPIVNIQNVSIFPDVQNKKALVKVKIQNSGEKTTPVNLNLLITGTSLKITKEFAVKTGENEMEITLDMGRNVKLWNEFHANLYTLETRLKDLTSMQTDYMTNSFGMREFKAVGKQMQINGQPTFLRGTLECSIFPKTGYPATDIAEWKRIFTICRAHGLNHMRFHSWCPPEAAFEAADQTGFYLQVECSAWATIGDGKAIDKYLYQESQRMVEHYGNHPSFCMMAYGNEPSGKNQELFLTDFVTFWKNKDNRRIYTSAAGWPNLPVNDYLSTSDPRIQHWDQGLKSIINAEAPRTDFDWSAINSKYPQPVVSHEIGQWCVYPNFKEIAKYDGVLRARNFEIFQETLKNHGMEQLADSFLLASGKLQALCYKSDIEAALRTPGFGGFQLLDLHDFPGQGTALVGVLDAFWDEKGYISAAEYKQFCNSTVPLARMKKCIFTNNELFEADVEIAHFGESPILNCTPEWKIISKSNTIFQSGKFPKTNIPLGNAFKLGNISIPLSSITLPGEYSLEVSVNGLSNSWDFWVYPNKNEPFADEEKIRVVQNMDTQTAEFLKNGGSVLLTLKKGTLTKKMGGDIPIGFSSIFWNTSWTNGQAPHTLGILCNPKHPALAEFPTEYYSNWQWWDAMSHSGAINISSLPTKVKPIVRVIDDWFTNRPLALVFEVKVGNGKLLVSGIDFTTNLENRPEAQQLLYSLKKYIAGPYFNPNVEINMEVIKSLYN